MDLSLSESSQFVLVVRLIGKLAIALTALRLFVGRVRAGLTAEEAVAVVAWKRRLDNRLGLATAVFTLAAFAGLVYAFHAAEGYRNRHQPYSLFFATPMGESPSYLPWAVPACLLAMALAAAFHQLLQRLCLTADERRAYRKAGEVVSGFKSSGRLGRAAFRLFVTLVLAVAVLMLDWYIRIEPTRIAVNRFWSIGERVYEYADVALLVETTYFDYFGFVKPEDTFHVVFRDGTH